MDMTLPPRSRVMVLPGLDAAKHVRHRLHAEHAVWVEKNCYADLWIELLHALGLEPAACLAFALAADFEGDQWTFFKPSHAELWELYGIDVQELTVWRPLLDHALEHLAAGKLLSTEADAYWLPDTAGTDYRQQHTKTTILLNEIDIEARRLGYFHNAGYFALEGDDFDGLFRLNGPRAAAELPLFAETVRIDRVVRRSSADLAARSRVSLARHLPRRPATNPITRFRQRLDRDLPQMMSLGLGHYHVWAFANVRQLGAAFELAAAHLEWLQSRGAAGSELDVARGAFTQIAADSKTLILKAARSINARRPLDVAASLADAEAAWALGMQALEQLLRHEQPEDDVVQP